MTDCYDKYGFPISLADYGRLFEDVEYRRVAETTLPDGRWVSTVWLGLDHSFGGKKPLIFESMVFASTKEGSESLDCRRYATLAEAKEGHAEVVAEWLKKGFEEEMDKIGTKAGES